MARISCLVNGKQRNAHKLLSIHLPLCFAGCLGGHHILQMDLNQPQPKYPSIISAFIGVSSSVAEKITKAAKIGNVLKSLCLTLPKYIRNHPLAAVAQLSAKWVKNVHHNFVLFSLSNQIYSGFFHDLSQMVWLVWKERECCACFFVGGKKKP